MHFIHAAGDHSPNRILQNAEQQRKLEISLFVFNLLSTGISFKTIAMNYPAGTAIDETILREWITAKLEPEAVEDQLRNRGLDTEQIREHLKTFRKLRNARRQYQGFFWTALGAFLGFLSCVLTILNPVPELYGVILFGLTSIAILLICLGLYFVFE